MFGSTKNFIKTMGVVWRGAYLLKDRIPRTQPQLFWVWISEMWSGNLHFNKVPRCLPCILESLELHPFVREKGVMGREQERERKETDRAAAAAVSCILAHALPVIWWNTAMQNGYNFQTATRLALHSGKMSRQGPESCFIQPFSQAVKSEAFSEEVR